MVVGAWQNFRRGSFDRAAKEAGLAGLVSDELRHTAESRAISGAVAARLAKAARRCGVYGTRTEADPKLFDEGVPIVKGCLTWDFTLCPRQDSNLRRTV